MYAVQVLLALRQQFGNPEDARVVIDYIKDCDMGFELAGVTVTNHRVLSLIASLVIGFIFAFGSTVAETLHPAANGRAVPTADELLAWCRMAAPHNATA